MSVCVSRVKFWLNEKIQQEIPKPPKVKQEYWDKLVNLRNDLDVIEKFEQMASITQGRPAKEGGSLRLQKSAVFNLVRIAP